MYGSAALFPRSTIRAGRFGPVCEREGAGKASVAFCDRSDFCEQSNGFGSSSEAPVGVDGQAESIGARLAKIGASRHASGRRMPAANACLTGAGVAAAT